MSNAPDGFAEVRADPVGARFVSPCGCVAKEGEYPLNISPHVLFRPEVFVASCPTCGRRLCWAFQDRPGDWYGFPPVASLKDFAEYVRRTLAERN